MTGLLYFIVVVMWASVLIPIGLKNHDRRNLEKSVSSADQTLPRWHWRNDEELNSRQRAFIRRRRVAMVLLSGLIATIILASSGAISFGWIALPIGLIALFGIAAKKSSAARQSRPIIKPTVTEAQPTKINSKRNSVVEKIIEEKVEVQKRTWVPIETPMPTYIKVNRATTYARKIEAERPWTGQEMVDAAVKLRQERAQKMIEAQARLDEARALALENARRAAMAANQNNGIPVIPFRRAANQ